MKELLGFVFALFSTLTAGLVSGVRLKPYLDASAIYTPPTFALYPALIAAACAILIVRVLFWWQGRRSVDIGPATFTSKQLFAVLWSLLYIGAAVTFFPYQPSAPPELLKTPQQTVFLRTAFPQRFAIGGEAGSI